MAFSTSAFRNTNGNYCGVVGLGGLKGTDLVAATVEDPSSGTDETILVAEDEVLVRLDISDYLRAHGYNVIEANSAAEAVQVLKMTWKWPSFLRMSACLERLMAQISRVTFKTTTRTSPLSLLRTMYHQTRFPAPWGLLLPSLMIEREC
jgi:hypothetical protein